MINPEKHFHLSFPINSDQANKARKILDNISEDEDKKQYADELIEVIDEISSVGLEFFFEKPLDLAGVNILKRKSVKIAVNTGRRGVMMVARKMIHGMSDDQLQVIADFMDNIIFDKLD